MAPLRLLAALLAAQLQLNFGQQINDGNNLVAVASHKLAAIKQQSQKQNVTDLDQTTDPEDNIEVTTDKDLEQDSLNSGVIYPGSGMITSIKFVRNPAYEGPLPTFSIVNIENASDPILGTLNHDTALLNFSRASPNSEPSYTAVGQFATQQTEDNVGFIGKSPLLISFAPRCSGAVSSQAPYVINALPSQPSSTNAAKLLPSPLKQTLSSAQLQPPSSQNPTNMRLRFVPAPNTVPVQSTGPARSAVPIQRQISIQNAIPLKDTVPVQNSVPIQSAVPIQSTLPIQSTVPIHNAIPIQRQVSNVPTQNPIANILQNPNSALFLSHVLSQNPVKQEYSTAANCRYMSQDPTPPKQTTVKQLLPLVLQLLSERNNNCCECKTKSERSHTYSRYKPGYKKGYNKFDADLVRSAVNPYHCVNQNKIIKKPFNDILDEDDYSDETSDYSAEEYDDED